MNASNCTDQYILILFKIEYNPNIDKNVKGRQLPFKNLISNTCKKDLTSVKENLESAKFNQNSWYYKCEMILEYCEKYSMLPINICQILSSTSVDILNGNLTLKEKRFTL